MTKLLYGSDLRLMECLRLRVKDIDFEWRKITVHDAKGGHERVTMLPASLVAPLQEHLKRVKLLHQQDLDAGFGQVYLPYALDRKYPNANKEWGWQKDVKTTMIYTHVLNRGGLAVRSPLD